MSIILAILQAIAAIPTIKKWFDEIVAIWISKQIESMKAENIEALRKALNHKDQRDLEKALGSKHAGEKSDVPGTIIVDGPPPK